MICVSFSSFDEWADELKARPPVDKIVRRTFPKRPWKDIPHICDVSLCAGFIGPDGNLIELVHYLGHTNVSDEKAFWDKAEAKIQQATALCESLGLIPAVGRFRLEQFAA